MNAPLYFSLCKRRDFVLLNQVGRFVRSASFTLRALERGSVPCVLHGPRVGFTVTKRLGNSVKRHRIRRRMKEALRTGDISPFMKPQIDYVLIAQPHAYHIPFAQLQSEMIQALQRVHRFLEPNHSVKVY